MLPDFSEKPLNIKIIHKIISKRGFIRMIKIWMVKPIFEQFDIISKINHPLNTHTQGRLAKRTKTHFKKKKAFEVKVNELLILMYILIYKHICIKKKKKGPSKLSNL